MKTYHLIEGNAGSGKTHKAFEIAKKLDRKVILFRNIVPTRNIGHLPGTYEEKKMNYFNIYQDVCRNAGFPLSKVKNETPTFIRGATYDKVTILIDEAQNFSYQELKAVLTRLGVNSNLIVVGDRQQCDLPSVKGYDQFVKVLQPLVEHHLCEGNFRNQLLDDFFAREAELFPRL